VESEVDSIQSDVDDAENRLDTVENDVDGAETAVDTLESEMDTIQSDVDEVESEVDSVQSNIDAVEVRLEAVEDGVHFDEVFSKSEGFQPTKGSVLTYIDIVDEMHFEMDITVHSFPSSWASILHCSDANYPRLPGIWIHPNSASGQGFHVKWSNADNQNYGPDTGETLVAGETYHLEVDIAQGSLKVTVDGVVKHEATGLASHTTYDNMVCYASDPWYDAADVTVSNLLIGVPDRLEDRLDAGANAIGELESDFASLEARVQSLERVNSGLNDLLDAESESVSVPVGFFGDYGDYAIYVLAAGNLVLVVCLVMYCLMARKDPAAKYGKVVMYDTDRV